MSDAVAPDLLRSFVERIERLESEKASIAGDVKEIYAEAKSQGFDTKIMRKVIALRKLDAAERAESEAILEMYMQALGMLADTPLGKAAVARDLGSADVTKGRFSVTLSKEAAPTLRQAAAHLRSGA